MVKVIRLKDNTIVRLEKKRKYRRETWDDIINKILDKKKK